MAGQLKKRITSLFLTAALLSAGMMACSDNSSNAEEETKPATGTEVEAAVTEKNDEEKVHDDLGEFDFAGATFGMMTFENQNFNYKMLTEETLAVPLNDAMYDATMKIKDRFNIDLVQLLYDDFSNVPKLNITAGDNTMDLVRIRCGTDVAWASEGLIVSPDETPYIDMSKPYWDKTINESLTVANKHFVALSSFDLCTYDLTFALAFNKEFISDYSLESPYELVKNGEWTMEKMNEQTLTVTADTNGDGKWTNADTYGYLSHPKMVSPGFWIGAGTLSIEKDENDIPYLNMGSEKFIDVWGRILDMCYSSHQYYGIDEAEDIPLTARQMFSENKALFMDVSFFFVEGLRSMEADFGIIPYPKYDTEQKNYNSRLCYYMPTVIPVTKVDEELDRCGVILEAFACEYYNTVIPAYYDITLQYKVARDEESQDMLDLTFASRVIDLGDSTFCGNLRDAIVLQMFKANYTAVASKAKGLENVINNLIKDLPGVE